MEKICVYGSISIDMSVQVERFPSPGEALSGHDFAYRPGGKGANQAVAAARLGANVQLISTIGYDSMGINMLEKIRRCGVGTRYVGRFPARTNVTLVFEDVRNDTFEPSMIMFSESKKYLNLEHLERCYLAIDTTGILMTQLSPSLDGVTAAAQRMKAKNGMVILDPAPPKDIPDDLISCVDILTPNQKELAIMSGMDNANENNQTRMAAAKIFMDRGVKHVVIKAGPEGAYIVNADGVKHVPTFDVNALNTWGVGSIFNSGLAVGLARDMSMEEAVRFANAACSLTILRGGSQDAVPEYYECMDLLHGRYQIPDMHRTKAKPCKETKKGSSEKKEK